MGELTLYHHPLFKAALCFLIIGVFWALAVLGIRWISDVLEREPVVEPTLINADIESGVWLYEFTADCNKGQLVITFPPGQFYQGRNTKTLTAHAAFTRLKIGETYQLLYKLNTDLSSDEYLYADIEIIGAFRLGEVNEMTVPAPTA